MTNRLLVSHSPSHLVTYTWDERGNLTHDGTFTYTYNAAGRMIRAQSVTATLVYTYNHSGLRVAQSVDGDPTSFSWDWATGVPEMLSARDALYLVGHDTLGQYVGSAWTYYLPDALGSVRHTVDGVGAVVSAREWSPYGVEVGSAQAGPSYTGEWWDAAVGLQYLRARWYDVSVGRFTRRDPISGFPDRPQTFQAFVYAHDNPINLTDHSGLAPWVDCSNWPTYLDLKKLCEQANGDDDDPDVLDAREAIFERITWGGQLLCRKEGVGYCWASAMLSWFLGASGSDLNITFRSSDAFPQDPGILRTTKQFREPLIPSDEPDFITPLLWAFLLDHVQPVAGQSNFSVKPVDLQGADYYSDQQPRPYDRGFWAAFGHVSVDGTLSAKGRRSCYPEGYVVRYRADYHIEDNYLWFEGKKTPFDFPGTDARVWIPHEWELSLVRAAPPRAQFYHFTISWTEKDRILVGSDFTWYREMPWWEPSF